MCADVRPARDVRKAHALPGSISGQAPSDVYAENQLRDVLNASILANATGTDAAMRDKTENESSHGRNDSSNDPKQNEKANATGTAAAMRDKTENESSHGCNDSSNHPKQNEKANATGTAAAMRDKTENESSHGRNNSSNHPKQNEKSAKKDETLDPTGKTRMIRVLQDKVSDRRSAATHLEQTDQQSSRIDPLTDPLLNRYNWPSWFNDAINHLETVSTSAQWTILLKTFVRFEQGLSFSGSVSRRSTNIVIG
jgi:hypothetical protein